MSTVETFRSFGCKFWNELSWNFAENDILIGTPQKVGNLSQPLSAQTFSIKYFI